MVSPKDQTPSSGKQRAERPHLFIVSCPYVFHHEGKPITYLFAVNSRCPPQALEYENWGLVALVESPVAEILRGGPEVHRLGLPSRAPERQWRISVGSGEGLLFQESIPETGWDENALKDCIRRIPESVLIIERSLEATFKIACDMAHRTYTLHRHPAPLCADCVQFGCEGPNRCRQRTAEEKGAIEQGRKFRLS